MWLALPVLPHRLADDIGMSVLHIVLRRFALVWFSGFCQEIHGNLFLEDGIAHIFFVFQNAAYGVRFPPMALPWGGNSIVHKNTADICATFPSQGKQVDEPHDSDPGFIDLNFAILDALIPQKQSGEVIDPLGVSVADGLGDIFGDGSALFFGKGTHQGNEELPGAVHGVDILFLKVDRHPGGFQAADGSEGIHGISGETGQRLCDDQINFTVQGIGYHSVETVTLADRQPGNTIIGVHPGKDPARMALDVFREIFLPGLETVLLGILHGGYSGISGNPFCGRRLFRGDCPGRELNPCNSCRPQCCSPPVRQLVHGIFLQRHGVKCVNHLLQ